jgi:hypothetical protein
MNKPTSLNREVDGFFSASYADARAAFLAAAAGGRVLHLPLDKHLSTEALWLGPDDAERVLVLISGTHGVEGAVGAAVELDVLACRAQLPSAVAVLLVFALNPHGFAHDRRCDSDGIDLNRNFIDFSLPHPVNPGYAVLMEAIHLPLAERRAAFEAYRRTHGDEAFEIAISGGQYTDPHGPFYGGVFPAHGNRCIEKIIAHYRLEGRHLAVVDIHSGLGPYGHGEIICDHLPGTAGFRAAHAWYGAAATAPADGTSSSVRKDGLLDYRWHALMHERGCFVTLEFGTYSIQNLFDTVLDDHHAWNSGDSAAIARSASDMREHFCPADGHWRELVLLKGRQCVQLALKGLLNE